MTYLSILAIASGGAIGAVLRHFVSFLSLKFMGAGFPYGTLSVNVLGSFVMGALIAYFAHHWNPPQEVRAFLTVGLLGAFTTFSNFSYDIINLWNRGEFITPVFYMLASVFLSIMAVVSGLMIVRYIYT